MLNSRLVPLLLAVILIHHGSLANRDELINSDVVVNSFTRNLQSQCPIPYVWKQPSWWVKYTKKLTKTVLKKCIFLEGKVPVSGSSCKIPGKVCMFGEARCKFENGVYSDQPETTCTCGVNSTVWTCTTVCPTPKCPIDIPDGTCNPSINTASCHYGQHCCSDKCNPTAFCSCDKDTKNWLCAYADFAPCPELSLEQVGCPCDRPVDGEACTADFECGTACCGAMAFKCKCDPDTGVYDECGKSGFVPGPAVACTCDTPANADPTTLDISGLDVDQAMEVPKPVISNVAFDQIPTVTAVLGDTIPGINVPGCPDIYPSNGDSCIGNAPFTGRFGCGNGCCGGDAYVCTCGTDGIYKCVNSNPPPGASCACLAPDSPESRN